MSDSGIVLTDEFQRALSILDAGGNLFLTGKAGTGKSTLIRLFMANTVRRVVVTAPTGIAALNVEGYTIHRLFSFNTTTGLEEVVSGGYRPGRFAKTLRSLETLIVDEASMVRADLFDMLVAALERFGPEPGRPFGGVQVVLVGDLFQLPPVVQDAESEFFSTRYTTPYFFSADRFDREHFPTVALRTVFRQLGDQRLTAILNAIREGVLLERARDDLNSRTDPEFVAPDDEFWLTLAPTNRIVGARNRERLERLPGDAHTHEATRSGDLGLFDPPVEQTLTVKVGAQIMMLTNDPANRWVNGTLGRIIEIANASGDIVVTAEFRDGTIAEFGPHTWDATRPVVDTGSLRHEVVGTYTQLPFKLAWAITIHKSQGQTLDRLVVDLAGGAFDFGQVYVALSRCTSMDGLVLKRPVLAKDLKTDRRILRFLRESTTGPRDHRYCSIGLLTVGEEGRQSRPRPVEIAVAFEDGTAIGTLVNPQRDLADAREAFGITVNDVLLAPTLPESWSVIGPLLEGYTPVGAGTDEALGLIDYELKRLGVVTPLPLGVDIPTDSLTADERRDLAAPTALRRARAAMGVHRRVGTKDVSATSFGTYEQTDAGTTYLLTRDPGPATPNSPLLPNLSGLLEISRALSEILLVGSDAAAALVKHPTVADPDLGALREVVADQLTCAARRGVRLPHDVLARLRKVDQLLGTATTEQLAGSLGEAHDMDAVLAPGARVCFTGTAQSSDGRTIERSELKAMASRNGLVPVDSVTKTRCDVLIAAELGTQSGKAKKAAEYGTPVFPVEEFLAWTARR
jgi:ATP-dependent DNA helicase PIF1